jgi:bifunctional ADP-heptose synthase (sugar kinase/adenylyltransferase)
MNARRLREITGAYPHLALALVGDFCLDRYLEIDPARQGVSIETGLPVHNVTRVRAQPGGAGTVLANLAALGVGEIAAIGFAGDDGEGFELVRAMRAMPGVRMDAFITTPLRRTFTYCKPLVLEPGRPPRELSRLDSRNWTPTPPEVEDRLIAALRACASRAGGVIVMEQTDAAGTGTVTPRMLDELAALAARRPGLPILADSRRGLRDYPAVDLKMNRAELAMLLQCGTRNAEHVEPRPARPRDSAADAPCATAGLPSRADSADAPCATAGLPSRADSADAPCATAMRSGPCDGPPAPDSPRAPADVPSVLAAAVALARRHGREVYVTLAEDGLVAARPDGSSVHVPSLPVRGQIDIVGAGDCVTANLAAARAAGASPEEALTLAAAAASVVIHKLGTTGTATAEEIARVMGMQG